MLVITILNKIEKHKGFVYANARFGVDVCGEDRIEVQMRPRKKGKARRSCCDLPGPCYDHLEERAFRYVPLLGFAVVLLDTMRRVNCPRCGVKAEQAPWATGKSPVTRSLALVLADWAKVLSWQEVGRRFGVGWHCVFEPVRYVVDWGLAHRDISGVRAIGIDEAHLGKGQKYLTVVYQLCGDVRRLLFVTRRNDSAALNAIFEEAGEQWLHGVTHVEAKIDLYVNKKKDCGAASPPATA